MPCMFGRPAKIGLLAFVCVASMVTCRQLGKRTAANVAVEIDTFHRHFNRKDFDAILINSTSPYRKGVGNRDYMVQTREEMGGVEPAALGSVILRISSDGAFVTTLCKTYFKNGSGYESFQWEGLIRLKLQSYELRRPQLKRERSLYSKNQS